MKLEKGMYVRYIRGAINGYVPPRIAKITDCSDKDLIKIDNGQVILRNDILKASKNIIDLIEVGDILLIKDFVDEACTIFTDVYYIQNENQLFNIKRDLEKNKNMKISKILTKEQFESMAYEVE